jgi:hypothetical protein
MQNVSDLLLVLAVNVSLVNSDWLNSLPTNESVELIKQVLIGLLHIILIYILGDAECLRPASYLGDKYLSSTYYLVFTKRPGSSYIACSNRLNSSKVEAECQNCASFLYL